MKELIDYLIQNGNLLPDSKGYLILKGDYDYNSLNIDCTKGEYARAMNLLKDLIVSQVQVKDGMLIINIGDPQEIQECSKKFRSLTGQDVSLVDGQSCIAFSSQNLIDYLYLRGVVQNLIDEVTSNMHENYIIEKLNKLDSGERYLDLRNIYEGIEDKLSYNDKQELQKLVQGTDDPDVIKAFLDAKDKSTEPVKEDLEDGRDEAERFIKFANKNGWHGFWDLVDYSNNSFTIEVTWGDWKHEHQFLDHLAKKYFENQGRKVEVDQDVTEDDGSDTYTAEHTFTYDLFDESYEDIVKPQKAKNKRCPKGAILPHADVDAEMHRFNTSTRSSSDSGSESSGSESGGDAGGAAGV